MRTIIAVILILFAGSYVHAVFTPFDKSGQTTETHTGLWFGAWMTTPDPVYPIETLVTATKEAVTGGVAMKVTAQPGSIGRVMYEKGLGSANLTFYVKASANVTMRIFPNGSNGSQTFAATTSWQKIDIALPAAVNWMFSFELDSAASSELWYIVDRIGTEDTFSAQDLSGATAGPDDDLSTDQLLIGVANVAATLTKLNAQTTFNIVTLGDSVTAGAQINLGNGYAGWSEAQKDKFKYGSSMAHFLEAKFGYSAGGLPVTHFGYGGERALDAISGSYIANDVLTVAGPGDLVILEFGGNDINYYVDNQGLTVPQAVTAWKADMIVLIDQLQAAGVDQIIIMGPTIFDRSLGDSANITTKLTEICSEENVAAFDFTKYAGFRGTAFAWAGLANSGHPDAATHMHIGKCMSTLFTGDYFDVVGQGASGAANQDPTAVIAGPGSAERWEEVSFNGSGSSDPDLDTLTWSWTFGDGQTGSGEFVDHTYLTAGAYTVTLTVNDGNSGTDTDTLSITVNAATTNTDGDSIPDFWEIYWFGDEELYDDNGNPDGDADNNLTEYNNGTPPNAAPPEADEGTKAGCNPSSSGGTGLFLIVIFCGGLLMMRRKYFLGLILIAGLLSLGLGCSKEEPVKKPENAPEKPVAVPEKEASAEPVETEAAPVEETPTAEIVTEPEAEPEPEVEVPEIPEDPPLKLADFGKGEIRPFEKGVIEDSKLAKGKVLAAKPKEWIGAQPHTGLNADWTGYDVLVVKAINPGEEPFKLQMTIKDKMNRGYWSWHNRYMGLAPGMNTLRIPMNDMWRGEVLRRDIGGFIDIDKIMLLTFIGTSEWKLVGVQIEKAVKAETGIANLRAFDVGKAGTPVLMGFTALTDKDMYAKEKGYGWTAADFARKDDRNHPDDLFRDNLSCRKCDLAIDLPNDTYRVHLQLEDPGAWEFMQHYEKRKVTAEGETIIEETLDGPRFMEKYFRNQDEEDFPGVDPFEKYVETRHPWHTVDIEVSDGQLNLGFVCWESYGNTLSAIILYPVSTVKKAEEYLAVVKERRRESWAQRWKPVIKPINTPSFSGTMKTEADRDGYALFRVVTDNDMSYNHIPGPEDGLNELKAAACRNEFEPLSFGLRPAKPLGKVEVSVSDLKGPNGTVIPASSIPIWVGRYRISRHKGHQSGMYSITEQEMRAFNNTAADTLTCDNGAARKFWLTVKPADDQAAGQYKGTVTVKAEKGGMRSVPIEVKVLPHVLPEPDFWFTMYGTMLYPMAYYPDMQATVPARKKQMFQDLRDHGMNYLKYSGARIDWKNGKAVITNMDDVKAEFGLREAMGFKEGPVGVGAQAGLKDLAYAETIKGQPRQEYIKNYFGEITRIFKEQGWPHPSFCFGDEPNVPETLNELTAAHNNLHAVDMDVWTNIAYHTSNKESYEMLKTVDVQHFKRFCSVEDFKKAKAAGKCVIASNVGMSRFAFGLWSWRAKNERDLDGSITFSYTGSHVDLYYALDAREGDYAMAAPRKDGTLAKRAAWERIREGVDDFRYAQLLDSIVKKSGPEAASAKALLDKAFTIGEGQRKVDTVKVPELNAWRSEVHAFLE
ncbi:PKD domain-containing protein [Planctomycetota bacterium]